MLPEPLAKCLVHSEKKILTSKTNKGPGQNKQPEGEMSQNKFSD